MPLNTRGPKPRPEGVGPIPLHNQSRLTLKMYFGQERLDFVREALQSRECRAPGESNLLTSCVTVT